MEPEVRLEHGENTGVIVEPRPTDYLAGGETAVVYEERNPSGDWEAWKPTDEWQRRKVGSKLGYDTLSCVTFSANNSIEIQMKWMIENGVIPQSDLTLLRHLGYLDENGNPNFSDWFSAILNGTTENGNHLQAPWDSYRKDGLLPQKDGKEVNDFTEQDEWLNPANVTENMRAKAKMFNEIFEVKYEWVVLGQQGAWDVMAHHLKHAPLHVATPTCNGWNTKNGIVPICPGITRLNHAHLKLGQTPEQFHKQLDHYDPFVKKLAWPYYMPYALKGVLNLRTKPTPEPPFKYTFNVNLKYGMGETAEVNKLQKALQTLVKDGVPYMKPGVFGPYGPQTRAAVGKFQTANGINDPDGQGTNFGPQTRKALNAALNG